eukprot:TRINITY_DN589_c0_g1_i1.p1 TRINITY_DN589_c0_g1~~TRINITY_DN589_c0_g1_i1.p1  ORF type:complete len:209 (-),score=19.03 TRINITY_DN589_c0_g1_i1:133-693(-)
MVGNPSTDNKTRNSVFRPDSSQKDPDSSRKNRIFNLKNTIFMNIHIAAFSLRGNLSDKELYYEGFAVEVGQAAVGKESNLQDFYNMCNPSVRCWKTIDSKGKGRGRNPDHQKINTLVFLILYLGFPSEETVLDWISQWWHQIQQDNYVYKYLRFLCSFLLLSCNNHQFLSHKIILYPILQYISLCV